ncbi:Oidioi.mRNA.OKI2018_I69.XSR.g15734.t1.cds [Oikopleura dioica]|uniref:Cytochrome b5 n=1 Tax=Oikopleura dioica TaxID=34765 RepID=A0ABN7SI00_OIKDI|nr:Oidioi.mRNA.OKI2018_I69.XSR.g15734.t1.cds [Oikopleura dioica]
MSKVFSLEEVGKHNTGKDCWMVIHNKVYDVTKFLSEHPGGEEILLECAGVDATEGFEDVGHSADARELLQDYLVGDLRQEDHKSYTNQYVYTDKEKTGGSLPISWLIGAVTVAAGAFFTFNLPSERA